MTQVCSKCGHSLSTNDRFCPECGAIATGTDVHPATHAFAPDITGTIHALGTQTTDSGPLSAIDDPADGVEPGTHVLMVVRGPDAGTRIELVGDKMTAGRSADTAIFLEDITVSREHANFELKDGAWVLVDLGSLNGTYVNRERVDRVTLRRGDEIQIGKYRFRYYNGDIEGVTQ